MTWLIVGLGNPGREYERTRHNVGFWVVDALADRHRLGDFHKKFDALYLKGRIGSEDVVLAKPQSFMNLSGGPAQALSQFFKTPVDHVVVVHDELDFDPGMMRVKLGGGAGGHNGLRSLIANITDGFIRVRVGVGKPPPGRGSDFVLSPPRGEELKVLDACAARAVDAVEMIVARGVKAAMEEFNRKA